MSNLIVAFLSLPLPKKRKWLKKYFALIRTTTQLPSNKHEWEQIEVLRNQLLDLGDDIVANYMFFLTLAGNFSLIQATDESFVGVPNTNPKAQHQDRLFFRNEWLPTAQKLTEILRTASSVEVESAKEAYVHSLIQCWSLKIAAFDTLGSINPIRLVHQDLPPIEDQAGYPQ